MNLMIFPTALLLDMHIKPQSKISVLNPFMKKRWYGGESYRWSNGARVEFSRWLSPNWQLFTAGEFSKQRYLDSTSQNGNNKLIPQPYCGQEHRNSFLPRF